MMSFSFLERHPCSSIISFNGMGYWAFMTFLGLLLSKRYASLSHFPFSWIGLTTFSCVPPSLADSSLMRPGLSSTPVSLSPIATHFLRVDLLWRSRLLYCLLRRDCHYKRSIHSYHRPEYSCTNLRHTISHCFDDHDERFDWLRNVVLFSFLFIIYVSLQLSFLMSVFIIFLQFAALFVPRLFLYPLLE